MLVYSVTVNIEAAIEEEWLLWMLGDHIPDVMATGCFTEWRMLRLKDPPPEEATHTYNIQYTCPDAETLAYYQQEHAPALQAEHNERFQNQFVAFRTLLHAVGSSK